MDATSICERLKAHFGDGVKGTGLEAKDPWISVESGAIVDVFRVLRDRNNLAFDSLSNLSGVDYKDAGYVEIVYHLYSYKHRHKLVVKVRTPREAAEVPSLERVWKAANWHEREVYDLLGVVFTGHPDLRRLLMPEDWPGHPLRKDFVEPEEYHGISTVRESLLD